VVLFRAPSRRVSSFSRASPSTQPVYPQTRIGETWLINTHFLQPIVLVPMDTGTYHLEVGESYTLILIFLAAFLTLFTWYMGNQSETELFIMGC